MTVIRLGERVVFPQREINQNIATAALFENLAASVFFPIDTNEGDLEFYIPRTIATEKVLLDIQIPNLGEYEKTLLGKILNPVSPVICIVGQMGSGKSTTLKLIRSILNRMASKRLVSVIDFRNHTTLNNTLDLDNQLITIINTDLLARLRGSQLLSTNDELTKFWEKEITSYNQGISTPSRAFRFLLAKIEDYDILDFKSSSDETLNKRKDILQSLRQEPELYLDYLLRLWGYTIEENPEYSRGLILLDNVDSLSADIQSKIVNLILRNVQSGGPQFIITVRPETFDRLGIGDHIFDLVSQTGPYPYDVVMNRLSRFVHSPEKYVSASWVNSEELNIIRQQAEKIYQVLISTSGQDAFREFLQNTCGNSIRSALVLATSMLVSIGAVNREITINYIIRNAIRNGLQQYHWNGTNIVHNLFRLIGNGQSSNLLVKLRILKLLATDPSKKKSLAEIKNIVSLFYDEAQIIEAINEMLLVNTQLLRSNTLDVFSQGNPHDSSELLTLTEIGEGYLRLAKKIYYIQEMMLDCYVNPDYFPIEVSVVKLVDTFNIVIYFLKELFRVDLEEVKSLVRRFGTKFYYDMYGTRLISAETIQSVHDEMLRIIMSIGKKNIDPEIADDYEEITTRITDLKALTDYYQEESEQLLGIRIN